jgi:dTDP-4-dehydrorhamnose 3,5-epimerase
MEPELIIGDIAVDDRGQISFVNDFKFKDIKRFYIVSNHKAGFIRAWHSHLHEPKYVMAINGTALVGAVRIDDFDNPDPHAYVNQYILSDKKPTILYIPTGFANGSMSLTDNMQLMYFATTTLGETTKDDQRYPYDYWDIWKDNPR